MSCDFRSKCRTCLNEASNYRQLIDYVEDDYKIIEMLDCIVPQIDIKTTMQFSTAVCQMCVGKLLIGYKFQQLCIDTNNRLHDLLSVEDCETQVKLETLLDPLNADSSLKIKEEIEGVIGCELETLSKKLEKSNNARLSNADSGSDTDSSICQAQSFPSELKLRETKKDLDTQSKDVNKLITFQCRHCPKSFGKKTSLAAHYRAHKKKKLLKTSENQNLEATTQNVKEIFEANGMQDKTNEVKELNSKTDEKIEKGIEQQILDENSDHNSNNELLYKHGTNQTINIDIGNDLDEFENQKHSNFTCEVCGKIFDRLYNLQRHSSVHSLARPYECEICKYRFATTNILKTHLFQHKNETVEIASFKSLPEGFKCTVCHRNFISMKLLARHFKTLHPQAEKHKCDHCSKTYILHDHLLEHLNRHKDDRKMCQLCKKMFGNDDKLKQHMRVHIPYLCTQCGKTFRGRSNLRQHMERHTGLKKYQCPECPSRFNCKSDVLKHASAHSNAKPHACDICGSRFTRKYAMQKHKALHSAGKPFKCDQCNMTFNLTSILQRHMRTHTGEKPYKCKYCERAYAESSDLTKHLRTHVGENTYICNECPMAFKYQVELRQHQSLHYKMNQKLTQKTPKISQEAVQHKQQNLEIEFSEQKQ